MKSRLKWGVISIFIVLLISIVNFSAADDPAGTPITGPVNITVPGSYYLAGDIMSCPAERCINISCSDVSVDGMGHSISGVAVDYTYGIFVDSPGDGILSNISLTNLSISGFGVGIGFVGVDGGVISENTLMGNVQGIDLLYTENSLVSGNNASMQVQFDIANGAGLVLARSNNNTFTNNILNMNGVGGESEFGGQGILAADRSSGNIFYGNTIHENQVCGIEFEFSCNDNVISDNSVQGNGDGIALVDQCDDNELTGNQVSGSNGGILIIESSGNRLRSNTMSGNRYNFLVSGIIEDQYLQDVDTSNTVDGKAILYLIGVSGREIGPAENPGTIYAIGCENITVRDVTMSKNGVGAFFWSSENAVFEDVTCSGNYIGFSFMGDTESLLLTRVHGNENDDTGIFITDTEGAVIQDSSASFNERQGIYVGESGRITVRNTSASHNAGEGILKGIGIEIDFSQEISLDETRTSLNRHFGIIFDGVEDMVIRDGVADGNEEVALVAVDSRDIEISGMRIAGNQEGGIGIENLTEGFIYNNYFNNTQNVLFEAPGALSTLWNTTRTAGQNIIGGPSLGGNFWATPDGTGWSETHPDTDGDGFVNEPYAIDQENTDFLPLASYPPARAGSIIVQSIPEGASVYIDSVYKGDSPLTVSQVPEGLHQVQVRKEGYADYTKETRVSERRIAFIIARLTPVTGTLSISSSPSGALVFIDGEEQGVTPLTLEGFPAGRIHILMQKEGYADWEDDVTVSAGRPNIVIARLSSDTGSIIIYSIPQGASVYVDSSFSGETPMTVENIETGTHEVRLEKEGYLPYEKDVTVRGGRPASLIARLNKEGPGDGGIPGPQ